MKKLYCFAALLLLAGFAQADEYYRSMDKAGKVHYGDRPPANAADYDTLKSSPVPAANEVLPYESRRAQEKFPVTLYVGDGCAEGCTLARDYLNKRGIPFTEKNLLTPEEIEAFKKASGDDLIPTLNIGKIWLQRFSESLWSKELDTAGYPQTAPFGFRPSVKSTPPSTEKPQSE